MDPPVPDSGHVRERPEEEAGGLWEGGEEHGGRHLAHNPTHVLSVRLVGPPANNSFKFYFYSSRTLKVPSGQIGSAWEWYHWLGLKKEFKIKNI
jgi:hypothetical protein